MGLDTVEMPTCMRMKAFASPRRIMNDGLSVPANSCDQSLDVNLSSAIDTDSLPSLLAYEPKP